MNARQKAFCEAYAETGNAAEAARKAGYSEKSARQQGRRRLRSGAEAARERMLQRQGITHSDSAPEDARRRMLERMGIGQDQEGGAAAARDRMIERGKRHGE